MAGKIFVDTNVLVYVRDLTEPGKQPRAAEWMAYLWRSRLGRLSVQVLQEYYTTVTQKLKPGMQPRAAQADVRSFAAWRPLTIDMDVLEGGWALQDRFQLSWWDALIVSAAQLGGCQYIHTEDL